MIEIFNRLQKLFGRPLTLVEIGSRTLVFRAEWWDKVFQVVDGSVYEQPTEFTSKRTTACKWIEDMLRGYIRDDAGNMHPKDSQVDC